MTRMVRPIEVSYATPATARTAQQSHHDAWQAVVLTNARRFLTMARNRRIGPTLAIPARPRLHPEPRHR